MSKKLYAVDADDSVFVELEEVPLATDEEILAQPCVVKALTSEYVDGHAAGGRLRFDRCKEDIARALGLPTNTEWATLVAAVRR